MHDLDDASRAAITPRLSKRRGKLQLVAVLVENSSEETRHVGVELHSVLVPHGKLSFWVLSIGSS